MSFEPTKRDYLLFLARENGYALEKEEANGLMIFVRGGIQVNVYTTTMTVGTSLHHPRKGKTQLFRQHVSIAELVAIFRQPRIHTSKGYRLRRHRPLC